MKLSMMDGSLYHHTGNPTNTTSYLSLIHIYHAIPKSILRFKTGCSGIAYPIFYHYPIHGMMVKYSQGCMQYASYHHEPTTQFPHANPPYVTLVTNSNLEYNQGKIHCQSFVKQCYKDNVIATRDVYKRQVPP